MSHLIISSVTQAFTMNVLSFSSSVYETISSAQTHTKQVHFPIRISQPDIEFTVIFSDEAHYERFQRFVRGHQQNSLGVPSLLTLNWPERNITNWTGFIEDFQAGGARRNYAPRANFRVSLVNSMVSKRTLLASSAPVGGWRSIYGIGMGADAVLSLPSIAEELLFDGIFGSGGGPGVGSAPY